LFWKGSLRYKMFSNVSKNAQLLVYISHDLQLESSSFSQTNVNFEYGAFSYASVAANFAHVPCVEFEVPYYNAYSQLLNYNYTYASRMAEPGLFNSSNAVCQFVATGDVAIPVIASASVHLFSAAGDDLVLNYYIGPVIFVSPLTNFPAS